MPIRRYLKNGKVRKGKKSGYKVENWSAYNQSLKKRGMLSLYFPPGDLESVLYNASSYVKGISGQLPRYQPAYIQLIYTFYRLFDWGMRQIEGYFEDLWRSKGLKIPVPSFGHLSELFESIPLSTKQFCEDITKRLQRGEKIALILDSTGFRFPKARDWHRKKYGQEPKKRPIRKLHLSIDPDFNTHAVEVTEENVPDINVMDDILPEEVKSLVNQLFADGGYYDHTKCQALREQGIIPVIPPPKGAVVHGKESTVWHDALVSYIQQKGSIYAFYKKFNYGIRERIEAHFSRITRWIGEGFKTIKLPSQRNEGIIIANIMNLWNSFGKPVSVKLG